MESTYNCKAVRQFAVMTVVRGVVGMLVGVLVAAAPAWGQASSRGELLYATHCASCHTERLHQREKSKIRSLADLRDEVARWVPQTKRSFTLDEIEEVVQYLNRSHYGLKK
jgi:mono/diheme cytochrome c family protein